VKVHRPIDNAGLVRAIYSKTASFLLPVTLNPNPTGFPYCVDTNPRES